MMTPELTITTPMINTMIGPTMLQRSSTTVSYTHLTLPTTPYV